MPLPTFTSGHDLAGRYRIIELRGVGHTAEVYSAEDLSLSRTVAVKVLLPSLAAHEGVRRAFRDHIVRASTLSHPHLARVFDGGQESGAIFMITEYLDGGSLEDVLSAGRTLEIDDVARLGRDVASALSYVHANGFVHGELSPSKLLFDSEGRVRVSDIALAGLGIPYREQLTLDDARYMSPEQAVGESAGPESDVYALALILFEAATGTAAFEGATPEATLRVRINSSLPVRVELGTLDMLLAQAAVADAQLRLSAEQFSSQLSAVVSDSTPLIVRRDHGGVPRLAQIPLAEPRNSIGFRPPSPDQIVGTRQLRDTSPQFPRPQPPRPGAEPASVARSFASTRPSAPRGFDSLPPSRPTRGRRIGFAAAAVLIVLVAVGGGAVWKFGLFSQTHAVPQLVDKNYRDVSSLLSGGNFTLVEGKSVISSKVPKDDVISQSPAAGASAKSGSAITVTVSKGPVLVTLPTSLIGESCAAASAKLKVLKLVGSCATSVASTRTASGLIAEVLYQRTKNPLAVPAGSTVKLVLSAGPGPTVPTTTTTTTTTIPTTTSAPTTTTTLAGEGLRAMPNVVGMNQSEVNTAMHNAGLYYRTQGPGAGTPAWTTVVSSVPAAGTMVKWHSTIVLNVK
jgi:serine/threonine-protein kinase